MAFAIFAFPLKWKFFIFFGFPNFGYSRSFRKNLLQIYAQLRKNADGSGSVFFKGVG